MKLALFCFIWFLVALAAVRCGGYDFMRDFALPFFFRPVSIHGHHLILATTSSAIAGLIVGRMARPTLTSRRRRF